MARLPHGNFHRYWEDCLIPVDDCTYNIAQLLSMITPATVANLRDLILIPGRQATSFVARSPKTFKYFQKYFFIFKENKKRYASFIREINIDGNVVVDVRDILMNFMCLNVLMPTRAGAAIR